MSINAYRSTLRQIESPRQIERRLMASVTGRLEAHAEGFDDAQSSHDRLMILSSGLRAALADNQKLWSALKFDLSDPANLLPDDLRARMISLALWVEKTTSLVLGGTAGVRDLVAVNNGIVAALSGEMAAEREPA